MSHYGSPNLSLTLKIAVAKARRKCEHSTDFPPAYGKDMPNAIDDRLKTLNIVLPAAAAPAANYVSYVMSGNLLFTAGQLPFVDGKLPATGILGAGVDIETGRACARQCAVNILAQAKAALGDLDRITRIVKLTVFVASSPEFFSQPQVANGCSDLMVEILGENGRHARSAVGVASLPLNAPVEIEAVIEFS
jgi:enamine deaminase RidA (YjgF/YER057c/UK114 family)